MQVRRLNISNFRGVRAAGLLLPKHAVLLGDNNVGKTTVLEALDLVLGPERLNRFPVVDEHDFFQGKYFSLEQLAASQATDSQKSSEVEEPQPVSPAGTDDEVENSTSPQISIEVVVIGLNEQQRATFGDYAEWWDTASDKLYDDPHPEGVDDANITQALRVTFLGEYDRDEDDFVGQTYFTRSIQEDSEPTRFGRREKQVCGFLYLRSLRTASRALSLERGSLLDVILRVKEIRPQMWESTLSTLSSLAVASDDEHGISGVLESISSSLNRYVPKDWGAKPHLRVSSLTRDHLRKVITAFVATGDGEHAAPFYRQGTGTINMIVLAMLSQIAADKQNVIFAMEEPETAIPPYAQKRIVQEVRSLASQAIFTSHSPYVLEEFTLDSTVVLTRDKEGNMSQASVELPSSVKLKRYRQEFRTRFCEGLLASRVLIAEGATEATAIPAAAMRLAELDPTRFASFEGLGVCTIDAGSENNIPDMAALYAGLGKRVIAVCDKQSVDNEAAILLNVEQLFMHTYDSIELLIVEESSEDALIRFADFVDWPQHITAKYPDPRAEIKAASKAYFRWSKGNWGIADFLAQCDATEMPAWIVETCEAIAALMRVPTSPDEEENPTEQDADDSEG